ncbi:MAG: DUF1350 family protein [Pleurocapsa sp.]
MSHSWVALHPSPKGVVQFIGGAFFGTFFPTIWYQHLLKSIFLEQEYTIIVLPFGFTIRHWGQALNLLIEQYKIRAEIIKKIDSELQSFKKNQAKEIHEKKKTLEKALKTYKQDSNYIWLGHSLGSKYISLLEILSVDDSLEKVIENARQATSNSEVFNRKKFTPKLKNIEKKLEEAYSEWEKLKKLVGSQHPFIRNQPSLLMSPDFSGTKSIVFPLLSKILVGRIPVVGHFVKGIERFFDQVVDAPENECGVVPTTEQTKHLVKYGNQELDLFNLTAVISFEKDKIAGNAQDKIMKGTKEESDVYWLVNEQLNNKLFGKNQNLYYEIKGANHFEPIAIKLSDMRGLEEKVIDFLDAIAEKQKT